MTDLTEVWIVESSFTPGIWYAGGYFFRTEDEALKRGQEAADIIMAGGRGLGITVRACKLTPGGEPAKSAPSTDETLDAYNAIVDAEAP